MNDLTLQSQTASQTGHASRKKKSSKAFVVFLIIWIALIGSGVYGAKWYTDHLQQSLSKELERQTAAQITAMQHTYEARIAVLEENYTADLADLTAKVNALNELLTFTKDNADTKTDNSNQLYTQLNEVKKKLNELQKSLDVLK